ncbi:MAG: hypothetical protein WC639_03220 [Patescibacteria group bacterium]|jgi:hypothetical protein
MMDIQKVALMLAEDESLGGTVFMELLKEGKGILQNDVNNGHTSTTKNVFDAMQKFFRASEEIAKVGDLNESQAVRLELMIACFKSVLTSFLLTINEKTLFQKLYESTPEGKEAVSLAKNVFTDPKKAREYMLTNGWAKETAAN